MVSYVVRRLVQSSITLFLISVCIFFMVHTVPGGPISALMRQRRMSVERIEQLRKEYGIDDPIPVRYAKWLGHVLRGHLGYSLFTKRPVMDEILDRLGNTVYLMLVSFIAVIVIAIPVGTISAVKQYSGFDTVATTVALVGLAIPEFWLGIILISVFYGVLTNPLTGRALLPSGGMYTVGTGFQAIDYIAHLVLPVATLSFAWLSWYSRFIRSNVLEVMQQEYITAARAKGLPERIVIYRHALKNAILPLITLVALDFPYLFGGSLYVEIVFSWPGMGQLFYQAATRRDYPVMMAILMIVASIIVFCNLIADIAYTYVDPRVRFGKRSR